jgi:hypothetical protein
MSQSLNFRDQNEPLCKNDESLQLSGTDRDGLREDRADADARIS